MSARNVNAAPQGRVSFTSDSFSDNVTVTVFMNVSVCLAVRLCFVCRLRGSSMLMKRRAKNSLTRWFMVERRCPPPSAVSHADRGVL